MLTFGRAGGTRVGTASPFVLKRWFYKGKWGYLVRWNFYSFPQIALDFLEFQDSDEKLWNVWNFTKMLSFGRAGGTRVGTASSFALKPYVLWWSEGVEFC